MKLHKILTLLLLPGLLLSACSLLEPEDDNHGTFDRVYREPAYGEGLLIRAYTLLPTNDLWWDDVATDNAVTVDKNSNYARMATGEWSAIFDPQSLWVNSYTAISYVNLFLTVVDSIDWRWSDKSMDLMFERRLKGEAYAMRGLFKYYLLRNHAGFGPNNDLLGTPIYDEFFKSDEEFFKPRATFADCVASADADFDKAMQLLPPDFGNLASLSNLPAGFSEITDISKYNTVFGDNQLQRITGRIAKAYKAKLALLAASPAFNQSDNTALWQSAATLNGELLADIGGVSGLDPKGHIYYLKAQVDEALLTSGDKKDLKEILWRRPITSNSTREQYCFPPSLYGDGVINPSQNLVDAFPMANGYPISDSKSNYNPATPYTGRDPRFALYIVYNGSSLRSTTIKTSVGGGVDGLEASSSSTRTGYYLKKHVREDVNVNPSSVSTQQHYITHVRYTEIFLNYAEAANEAWGPDGKGTFAFSAREVIAAIRKRAGITQPDAFLATITDKTQMRALIKNERRLELCFEDSRFWDLRRWKEDLTTPAKGVRIEGTTYTYFTVENRLYDNSYMHYGPVPDGYITKFNLVQNKGWN